MKRRIISLLLTVALVFSMSPCITVDVSAELAGVDSLTCASFISNETHRVYIDKMMKQYLWNNSALTTALDNGKSVTMMFEGGSDNYPSYGYSTSGSNVRNQALTIVLKKINETVQIVFHCEDSSTIPSQPADRANNVTTLLDGIYSVFTLNHKGQYAALQISSAKGYCISSSSDDGWASDAAGINLHTRSTNTAGSSGSAWSEGCLLIGSGNDTSNPFNAYMKAAAGIDFNAWVAYKSESNGEFTEAEKNITVGYCVIDRQLALDGLTTLYSTYALSQITAASGTYEDLGDDFFAHIYHPASGYGICNVNENVELGEYWTTSSLWRFVQQSDGSYILYSAVDGKVMDVFNNDTANKTNVQVYTANSTSAQKWFVVENGGGYGLVSASSYKGLDITGDVTYPGANAAIYNRNDHGSQIFDIVQVSSPGFTVSTETINLNVDGTNSQTVCVKPYGDFDGDYSMNCYSPTMSCTWGDWNSDGSILLTLSANNTDDTYLRIRLYYSDTDEVIAEKYYYPTVISSSSASSYTVSYSANGGSGAPASQTKFHGYKLTLSSAVPTRDGYAFLGWAMSSSATAVQYSAGSSYSRNAEVTLYAVWKKTEPVMIAGGTCGLNLTWELDDEGTLTISGTGAMSDYEIGGPWSSYMDEIKKVIVSEGVTTIGETAFFDCANITSVVLPNSLEQVGECAFLCCESLTSVVIPEGVTTIGDGAFSMCYSLEAAIIPLSVTEIISNAFYDCTALTYVYYAGTAAQWEQVSIEMNNECLTDAIIYYTTVAVPVSMYPESAHDYAEDTDETQTLTWPGAEELRYRFSSDTEVETNYDYIRLYNGSGFPCGEFTGTEAAGLTGSIVGDTLSIRLVSDGSVQKYGYSLDYVVAKMPSVLTDISVKTQPTKTEYWVGEELDTTGLVLIATYSDGSTADITEGYTVSGFDSTSAGTKTVTVTYEGFTATFNVVVRLGGTCGENLTWMLDDEGILTISGTGAMTNYEFCGSPWYNDTSIKALVIEDGVTTIGDNAFFLCLNMTSVTIPDSVTYIGCSPFSYCDLTGIWVDENNPSYSSDDRGVLFNKDKTVLIKFPERISGSYTIPDSVTNIYLEAFLASHLTNITIPENLTDIGDYAFHNCKNLTEVYYGGSAEQWAAISIGSSNEYLTSATIHTVESVLTGIAVNTQPTKTEYWVGEEMDTTGLVLTATYSDGSTAEIAEGFTTSGFDSTIAGTKTVTVIYEGYTATFDVAVALGGICGENLTWMLDDEGTLTISGTGTMTNYTSSSKSPWYDNSDIKKIVISNGVTSVGSDAFLYCDAVTDISFGNSVVSIGTWAFYNCIGLTEIILPNSTTDIASHAFQGCTSLTSATIPDSITNITDYAFYNCTSLADVYYGGTAEQWAAISIGSGNDYLTDATIHTVEPTLTGIAVNTQPTKTEYWIGEELDTTGMVVTATYSDGSNETVTEGFTTAGFDSTATGTKTVTVTYEGFTATFAVTVNEKIVDENAPQVVVDTVYSVAGNTVDVVISLKNNPGLASAKLQVEFDSDVLTLTKVTDAGQLGVQVHKPELVSPYILTWANDTATENFVYDGTIVTLTFQVAEDAPEGVYPISVLYDYDNYDIIDCNMGKVKFALVNGSVEVVDVMLGDINGDSILNTLDRVLLTRYLAGWDGYTDENVNMTAADMNMDGVVNTLDRVILTRHLAGWGGYEDLPYAG